MQTASNAVELIQEHLDQLVNRIVEAVHPLRVILFGSAGRGEMALESDLDVLVVVPDGTHRRHTAQYLYQRMIGMSIPVDIVVATPTDLEKHKNTLGLIYRNALREGRELYAA